MSDASTQALRDQQELEGGFKNRMNETGPCENCGKEIPINKMVCSEKCREEFIKKLKAHLKELEERNERR